MFVVNHKNTILCIHALVHPEYVCCQTHPPLNTLPHMHNEHTGKSREVNAANNKYTGPNFKAAALRHALTFCESHVRLRLALLRQ